MYICVCHAVTDKAIVRAIENGKENFEAIQQELLVATACGSCKTYAQNFVKQCVKQQSKPIQASYLEAYA